MNVKMVSKVVAVLAATTLALPGGLAAAEEGRGKPDDPGAQGQERRAQAQEAGQAQAQEAGQAQAGGERAEEAPHGQAEDRKPDAAAAAQARGQGVRAQDDVDGGDNVPTGNKGSVKVRSVGAAAHPPRHEPHVDCVFEVLFYGFTRGPVSVSIATHAPTAPTGVEVATGQVGPWPAENRRGNELVDRLTIDLNGVVDDGTLTHHAQQGYHLKLTATNLDRDDPGNRKHKVFWVDCPPPGAEVGAVGAARVDLEEEILTIDVAAALEARDDDEAAAVEVAGVLVERGAAPTADVAGVIGERPPAQAQAQVAPALAVTGLGLLMLVSAALVSLLGGAGALRLGRRE